MTNSEFYKTIKLVEEVKPNLQWVMNNRSALLSQIGYSTKKSEVTNLSRVQDLVKPVSGFVWNFISSQKIVVSFGRPLMASLAGVALLLSGVSVMAVSRKTVPGNILYPVKIAEEKVQLSFASSVEEKIQLETRFAGHRIDELNRLTGLQTVSNKQTDEKIAKAMSNLKNNITTIKTHLADLTDKGEARQAMLIAKELDSKIIGYAVTLNKLNNNESGVGKVNEALNQVESVSDKTLAVMVAKQSEVKDVVSNVEIAEKLNNKIAFVEKGINQEKQAVTQQVFQDAKDLVNKGDFAAALVKIDEGKEMIEKIKQELEQEKTAANIETVPAVVEPSVADTEVKEVPATEVKTDAPVVTEETK